MIFPIERGSHLQCSDIFLIIIIDLIQTHDTLFGHSSKMAQIVEDAFACYHEILNSRCQVCKQTALDSFFKKEHKELNPLTVEHETGISGIQVKKML
jgi:hypothetical protein